MTPKEEGRLAALTGLYQAERAQLSGLSAQAVTLYSMAVAYSAAVAAVWSSGKFEISSDWSRALILALPAPAAMILGYRAVLGAAVAGHNKAAREYERDLLAAAGYTDKEKYKGVPMPMLGLRVDDELGDLGSLWRSRADRPGLLGSAALFYAIGVVIVGILTVVCLVRAWPSSHSFWLWLAWVAAFVLYVGAALTLGIAWCREIPKVGADLRADRLSPARCRAENVGMDLNRAHRTLAAWELFLTGGRADPLDPIAFFRHVAETVPGYRKFLDAHGIDPASVITAADFDTLPLLTKDTYHRRYRLADICRAGRLDGTDIIAVSSGSSGQPTPWPRSVIDELAIAARFEQVFRSFRADTRTTLAVVCFPLGTWVGGLYSAACVRHLNAKGYSVTVVAPGNNKGEILRVIGELAPNFDQAVLLGYPPFVKDVIDSGIAGGLDWHAHAVKLVFAGEVFSEEWRNLVAQRAGVADPVRDTAALYGTADAGVLGNETPLSVTIRAFLARNPGAAMDLFGQSRLPTLVQYDRGSRYFQTHDGTLLFTGDNGIPLVRYHIADEGGIVDYDGMLAFCSRYDFDPLAELDIGREAPRSPFVYLFGRSLFTVSYYGANIYPENITVGLEQPDISGWVTGKFVIETYEDTDRDRRLRVTVELAPERQADAATIACSIRDQLLRLNSEFAHYVPGDHQLPEVQLRPAGDPKYFPVGVKHRYTRRPSG